MERAGKNKVDQHAPLTTIKLITMLLLGRSQSAQAR
jgi:hypothetical protein